MFKKLVRFGKLHKNVPRRLFSDERKLYFDVQATTPLDPRVVDAMIPYMVQHYGNPHSRTHIYGKRAEQAVEQARVHVAGLIHAQPQEIIYSSGATESNNIAIKGVARFARQSGTSKNGTKKNHLITTQMEHKCILDTFRWLQQDGWETTFLKPDNQGIIHPEQVAEAIRPDTLLVSVMAVNNEIGTVQDIKAIGEVCKTRGVLFHSDVAQAVGKVDIDVNRDNIDMLSISAHKLYGPKGIGALYIRRKPRVKIASPISGGGQERNIRSGTLATHQIVGFGEACRIAHNEMDQDRKHIKTLYDYMIKRITTELTHVVINGSTSKRWFGNLNASFSGVEGEALMCLLNDICVSSGSACTSSSLEASYVLRSIDAPEDMAHTSLRFGISKFTTKQDIDQLCDKLVKSVNELRSMSALWEMIEEGIDISKIKWSH